VRDASPYALLGAAPDLDLLVGLHSRYTHSIGAAVLTGVIAWAWLRRRSRATALGGVAPWQIAAACAAAVASHILLDWLGDDTTPPIGIMALWPLASGFYQSNLHVFGAVSRRFWLPEFYAGNALVALREVAILLPIVWIVGRFRTRKRSEASERHD
jgi:LexA-binding, inner membrane-associated putative hydrolase